jgi:5'-phosphate synthase pdxT subunit
MQSSIVGVLALQGAYQKHVEMLSDMSVETRLVVLPAELSECAALIIPGGESTTMSLLIQKFGLYKELRDFAMTKPVMGVCAGTILMAKSVTGSVEDERVRPLGVMPLKVSRNHYGRQVNSCTVDIPLKFDMGGADYQAHFIRAPGIDEWGKEVHVVAKRGNDAVMLRMKQHIALTFHPELTRDNRIHKYWLNGFHPSFQ